MPALDLLCFEKSLSAGALKHNPWKNQGNILDLATITLYNPNSPAEQPSVEELLDRIYRILAL
jgi:hypothetical protein